MIPYGKHEIDESDIREVVSVLRSDFLTQGPKVQEFEKMLASYVGAKYAVAMSSWTSGLHMACIAIGLEPGQRLLTSPISFVASSNCAFYVGATPEFCDIEPRTINLSPTSLDKMLEEAKGDIKVVIPVHFGGLACDMPSIQKITQKHGAVVVEDAAHALGAKYANGKLVGNCEYSLMTGFSFHPVKGIACGEGGMITTNCLKTYKQLLRIRGHGINKNGDELISKNDAYYHGKPNPWYYEMQELGYNYRITDIQSALGVSQLRRIDTFLANRCLLAQRYDEIFSEISSIIPIQKNLRNHSSNHLYVVKIQFEELGIDRFQFITETRRRGVQTHVHYIPIPMQPYYTAKGYSLNKLPNALSYYKTCVTLPIFSSMSHAQQDFVVETVLEALNIN